MNLQFLLKTRLYIFLCLIASTIQPSFAQEENTGRISGTLVDADTGEILRAAQIIVEGTSFVAYSDLDGNFRMRDIPAGTYTLQIDKFGYQNATVTDLVVTVGEVTSIELGMKIDAGNVIEFEAFVISASEVQSTEVRLLADRQNASAISDAIGSEDFSRFGAGDAADAMSRVTGVSINDGKYVFVRGLGERYSNTLMNGVSLPSADPDKKAVQMDQFPTDLLDSIVTSKSFTPDLPGDFAGGSVNIKTRSFPNERQMSISSSIGYNTNASLIDDFLRNSDHGDYDWLGFDDGTRSLPDGVPTDPADYPNQVFEPGAAEFFDSITRAFNASSTVLGPSPHDSYLDLGFSYSYGNSFYIGEEQLIGVVASLTYDLSYDHYEDGENNRFERISTETDELFFRQLYADTKSTISASLGGLISLAYQPNTNNEFQLVFTSNQSASDEARFQEGFEITSSSNPDNIDQVRSLTFVERNITSLQLNGDHFLEDSEIKINWSLTATDTSQEDPDVRFANNELNTVTGRTSLVKPDRAPRRLFRDLSENQWSAKFDLEIPILDSGNLVRNFKFGGVISEKNRDFSELIFNYSTLIVGNFIFSDFTTIEDFLNEENIGIMGDGPLMNTFISPRRLQVYEGTEEINSLYGMVDFEINEKWRFITGVRQETTDLSTELLTAARLGEPFGTISDDRALPAAHLVYKISETQNVRAAWSKTLARPTFREIAPYASTQYLGDEEYLGNADLVLTGITNYDLRWEWFPNPGEIISVGAFCKEMENPIELVQRTFAGNFTIQPQNVPTGEVLGLEFEFRKDLFFIHESLQDFSINTNVTVSQSEVSISTTEIVQSVEFFAAEEDLEAFEVVLREQEELFGQGNPELFDRAAILGALSNSDIPLTRDLFGQPDLIVNFSVNYENPISNTAVSVNFNYVSDKMALTVARATPDVYDRGRDSLDVIIKQGIGENWTLKFSAKNLTDSKRERYYFSEARDIYSTYTSGSSFSISASYDFN